MLPSYSHAPCSLAESWLPRKLPLATHYQMAASKPTVNWYIRGEGGARTHNLLVNSQLLYRWATSPIQCVLSIPHTPERVVTRAFLTWCPQQISITWPCCVDELHGSKILHVQTRTILQFWQFYLNISRTFHARSVGINNIVLRGNVNSSLVIPFIYQSWPHW